MASEATTDSLTANCPGGLDWAWYGLGECIRTDRDKVSIAFGIMSIISWCLFGFPQIWENFKKKIPDAAVSMFLLLFWLLGDSLNFIGAFLTNQLFMQKLLAGYTVVIDIVLCAQYLYYLLLHKRKVKRGELELTESEADEKFDATSYSGKKSISGKVLATVLLGVVTLTILPLPLSDVGVASPSDVSSHGHRHLFESTTTSDPFANFLPTDGEKIGYAFGWASAIMYVFGRSHQIYLNWRRQCTEGLSYYLFILAVLGNTFYSCQIFTKSIDAVFVVTSLPWILGSLGILLFDFVILMQFFKYRHNRMNEDQNDFEFDFEEDEGSTQKQFR